MSRQEAGKIKITAPPPPQRIVYIDADGQVLGRLASHVAKLLRNGYRVYIVNAEKAVISGDPHMVIRRYQGWLRRKVHVNPYKWGPRRPRTPTAIVRRAVKGMLPKNWSGRLALTRLRVYIGVPRELEGKKFERFPDADVSRLARKYIRVGEVAKALGWKGVRTR